MLRQLKRSRQLTAIHLDRDEIMVLSLKQETNGCKVLASVRGKRSAASLAADLGELFKSEPPPKGKAVVVTDDVRFLSSDLRAAGSEHLSEEKLLAAATWEMEPYLDFPASEGLFECRTQPKAQESNIIPVLISAASKRNYEELASTLKRFGLELVAAYAPLAALACSSKLPGSGRHKVLVDCGKETARVVLLSEKGPVVFQDNPRISGDQPFSGMIRDTLLGLGIQGELDTEIVVSGPDPDQDLLKELSGEFPSARRWGTADAYGTNIDPAVAGIGSEYALAACAAFGVMGLSGKTIPCVTDRVPLVKAAIQKLKKNKSLIPAAVLGCFFLCLGVHYGYTLLRISLYDAAIRRMEGERKKLESPLAEEKRLRSALANIEEKRVFLQDTLRAQGRNALVLLTAISEMIPTDVVVNKVDQPDSRTFLLSGNAFRGKGITDFSDALSSLDSCEGVFLVNVRRAEDGSAGRRKILPYDFTIRVLFAPKRNT